MKALILAAHCHAAHYGDAGLILLAALAALAAACAIYALSPLNSPAEVVNRAKVKTPS